MIIRLIVPIVLGLGLWADRGSAGCPPRGPVVAPVVTPIVTPSVPLVVTPTPCAVPSLAVTPPTLVVPLYSVSYDSSSELRRELEALREELKQLRSLPASPPMPIRERPTVAPQVSGPKGKRKAASAPSETSETSPPLAPSQRSASPTTSTSSVQEHGLSVLSAHCQRCHEEARAEHQGGGVVLFTGEGSWRPAAKVSRATIRSAIADGSMPPGRPLSPEQRHAALAYLKP